MSGRILLGGVRFYANNRKFFITFKRYVAVDRPEPSFLRENISVPVPRRACVPLVNILLRILSGESGFLEVGGHVWLLCHSGMSKPHE